MEIFADTEYNLNSFLEWALCMQQLLRYFFAEHGFDEVSLYVSFRYS